MDKAIIIVLGNAPERNALYDAWAKGQDPWYIRRDIKRVDARSLDEIDEELALRAKEILNAQNTLADENLTLQVRAWPDHQYLLSKYPDSKERLRQLRLYHLRQGWPKEHLPRRVDTPARLLGYLLQSKGWILK